MKAQCLITYRTTLEKRREYAAAAKALGTDVTSIIREALEQALKLHKEGGLQ